MFRADSLPRSRYHRPAWPRGPWPDDSQLLLLQACLLEDAGAAIAAWTRWRSRVMLDEIDAGSVRLLPLLHRRIADAGITGDDCDRIKGVARYYWVQYQQQMPCLRSVLTLLGNHGIETLLLKGAALNLTVYPAGARPMVDLDVVVPRDDARRAMQVLRDHQWQSTSANPERLVGVVHGCQFEAVRQKFIDLHWDFFHGRVLSSEQQRPFWEASEPVDAAGVATRVLAPAHQLLHTCVHGARAADAAPLRWLADACLIIRKQGGRIDWDMLVDLAQRHELSLPVWTTLSFLAEHLQVPIPKTAMRALRRTPVAASAKLEYYLAGRRFPGVHPFWNSLPLHLVGYWRHRRREKRFRLGEYLQLQHHYKQPLSRYLPRLCHLQLVDAITALLTWGRSLWARLRRHAREHIIDVGSAEYWRLQRFHNLEMWRGRLFRWSNVDASVLLTRLAPADYRVEISLAGLRDWRSDLESHLAIAFNGHPIPRETIAFRSRELHFSIRTGQFVAGERQKLTLRCRPLAAPAGESRQLGVPICSIRITPQPMTTSQEAA